MDEDNYLVETTMEDIDFLAPRLRQADIQECQAASGMEPKEVLIEGLKAGHFTFTLTPRKGVRVGIWGVVKSPTYDNAGIIWMMATEELLEYQIKFLRRSRVYIELVQKEFSILHNVVDARNELHIKWLKFMGFKFIQRHENFGVAKLPFYEFLRI